METFFARLKDFLGDVAEFSHLCLSKTTLAARQETLRQLQSQPESTDTVHAPKGHQKKKSKKERKRRKSLPMERVEELYPVVSEFVVHPHEEASSHFPQEICPDEEGVTQANAEDSRRPKEPAIVKRLKIVERTNPEDSYQATGEEDVHMTRIQVYEASIDRGPNGLERLPRMALQLWEKGRALYLEHQEDIQTLQVRCQELECRLSDWGSLFDIVWVHILPSVLRDLKNYDEETCYKQFSIKEDTWQYLSELDYQEFKARVSHVQPPEMQVFLCDTLFDAMRSLSKSLRKSISACCNETELEPLSEELKWDIRDILTSPYALKAYKVVSADLTRKELKDLVNIHVESARTMGFSNASFHGLTLSSKTMLLDHLEQPGCSEFLVEGSYTIFFLHELAHVTIRRSANTLKECYETYTPEKGATHADLPIIANPLIPHDVENTAFSEKIDTFLPHQQHQDAGDQVETFLFGRKLDHLTIKAYRFMLDPRNLKPGFKERFQHENTLPRDMKPGYSISLARGKANGSESSISFKGCKYSYYDRSL